MKRRHTPIYKRKIIYFEFLIALFIAGVIFVLIYPKLQIFLAKARQSEAKKNLSLLYSLQIKHFNNYGKYEQVSPIGINNCDKSIPVVPAPKVPGELTILLLFGSNILAEPPWYSVFIPPFP